jgi:hypothetical protein
VGEIRQGHVTAEIMSSDGKLPPASLLDVDHNSSVDHTHLEEIQLPRQCCGTLGGRGPGTLRGLLSRILADSAGVQRKQRVWCLDKHRSSNYVKTFKVLQTVRFLAGLISHQ